MEHVITSNISRHLTQHNVLYELQHGFREKRCCETQLIELVEDLARQLTLGKQTDLQYNLDGLNTDGSFTADDSNAVFESLGNSFDS